MSTSDVVGTPSIPDPFAAGDDSVDAEDGSVSEPAAEVGAVRYENRAGSINDAGVNDAGPEPLVFWAWPAATAAPANIAAPPLPKGRTFYMDSNSKTTHWTAPAPSRPGADGLLIGAAPAGAVDTATAPSQHTTTAPAPSPTKGGPGVSTEITATATGVDWVLPAHHTDTWVNKKIGEGLLEIQSQHTVTACGGGSGGGASVLSGPSYFYPIFSEPLPTADIVGVVRVRVSVSGSSNCVLGVASAGTEQRKTFQKSKDCYGIFLGGMSNGEVYTAGVRSRRSWAPKSYDCPCVLELTVDTAACTLAVRLVLSDPRTGTRDARHNDPSDDASGDSAQARHDHEIHVVCSGLPTATAFRVCAGTYSHDCRLAIQSIQSVAIGDLGSSDPADPMTHPHTGTPALAQKGSSSYPADTGDVAAAWAGNGGGGCGWAGGVGAGGEMAAVSTGYSLNDGPAGDYKEPALLLGTPPQSPEWDYIGSGGSGVGSILDTDPGPAASLIQHRGAATYGSMNAETQL